MAHGNRKKASEGDWRSTCYRKRVIPLDLETEVQALVASGQPVLTICRKVAELREEYANEAQGRVLCHTQ